MTDGLTFLNPMFLWLLLLIPVLTVLHIKNRQYLRTPFRMSSIDGIKTTTTAIKLKPVLFVLRMLALGCIVIALARPRLINMSSRTQLTEGIDIVLAIDVSGSMLARDLLPNRMEALKGVARDFVIARRNDRIGLVVYAAEAYTRTPVTSDKAVVEAAVRTIQYDDRLQDGTAIGMGLATAVNRLKDSKAMSKVIILMTDGVNNAGFIEPVTASNIAKEYGIKVYTIGIGTNGMAEFAVDRARNGELIYAMMPVQIDEELMQKIASNTDGKYFRATNNRSLAQIYDEINKLEKSEIEELKFYDFDEKFRPFAIAALLFVLVEVGLRNTVYRGFI